MRANEDIRQEVRKNGFRLWELAEALGTEPGRISVKATTEEGLGFTGSGEGIAAHAVVLLEERSC